MRNLFRYSGFSILAILLSGLLISQAAAQSAEHKLAESVQQKISNYYPENNISVKAEADGRIELGGAVNVLYDKLNLFDIASGVKGVRHIINNIVVNTSELPDNEILVNIKDELNSVKTISEPDLLNIAVTNGVVLLRGQVRFQRESTAVETVASWQDGVKGIVNELTVMPWKQAISDETLNATINDLLGNQFGLENQVRFNVSHGQVTLDGNTRSLWAKRQIENEVKRIAGVTKVTNNLNVADYIG